MAALGRYTLVQKIGSSGLTETWKACLPAANGSEKAVAIRRVRAEFCVDPAFVRMFSSEVKRAQHLDNSNVVRVLDFGSETDEESGDPTYYMVMEYLSGKSLADLLKKQRILPLSVIVHVGSETARGMTAAHLGELLHRDLSPENILISWDGEVKVGGFGVARAAALPSVTRTGVGSDKVAYMSPEQAAGETVDPGTDIYALGLILFEMATGKPFFAGSVQQIVKRQGSGKDPTREEMEAVPEKLREIVFRALRAERKKRYATAAELEAALAAVPVPRVVPRDLLHAMMVGNFAAEFEAEASGAPVPLDPPVEEVSTPDVPEGEAIDTAKRPAAGIVAPEPVRPKLPKAVAAEPPEPRTRVSKNLPVVVPPMQQVEQEDPENRTSIEIHRARPPERRQDPLDFDGLATLKNPIAPPAPDKSAIQLMPLTGASPVATSASGSFVSVSGGETGFLKDMAPSGTHVAPIDRKKLAKERASARAEAVPLPTPWLKYLSLSVVVGLVMAAAALLATQPPPPLATPTPGAGGPLVGMILVKADQPDADLWVDGKHWDVLPAQVDRLPVPSTVVLMVKKKGFEPWCHEVDVADRNRVDVTAVLQPRKQSGLLTIDIPEGATASVDGRRIGHPAGDENIGLESWGAIGADGFVPLKGPSNESVDLQPGTHQVRLRTGGRIIKDVEVEIKSGESVHL